MKTCVVLLAEGFEETEAVVPADILRRAGVQVRLVAVGCVGSGNTALCIKGAHGIKIEADLTSAELLAEIEKGNLPDAVFCPGGMPGSTNLVKKRRCCIRFACGKTVRRNHCRNMRRPRRCLCSSGLA